MSHWLLTGLTLFCTTLTALQTTKALAAPTSTGPTSSSEAEYLWKEGQAAITHSEFQKAAHLLQRYVDRYPAAPGTLQAHLLLGRALLELEKHEQVALTLEPVLQSTLQSTLSTSNKRAETPELKLHARIYLGRAQLQLKKYSEAYLTALENEKAISESPSTEIKRGILLESLLIKGTALLALKQEPKADKVISDAENLLAEKPLLIPTPRLVAWTHELRLKKKLSECQHNPLLSGSPSKIEVSAHKQVETQGNCLLEALIPYRTLLKTKQANSIKGATSALNESWNTYLEFCSHPPGPSKTQTKSTPSFFRSELSHHLIQTCDQKTSDALLIMNKWEKSEEPLPKEALDQIKSKLKSWRKS